MRGQKVLIVGASGFVGYRLALELCSNNRVYGVARFRDERVKKVLEKRGVTCIAKDISKESIEDLPQDFDYVFDEVMMTEFETYDQRQKEAIALNGYLVGRLMRHCRRLRGMIYTSSNGIYPPSPGKQGWKEDDNIGPLSGYAFSKFAGEVVATFASESWNTPLCILRLSYPYSADGGAVYVLANWIANRQPIPVNRRKMSCLNPIHLSDYVRYSAMSADLCSVPPRIINAGGSEVVTVIDLLERLGEALGIAPIIVDTDAPRLPMTEPTWVTDTTLLNVLMGKPMMTLGNGIKELAERIKKLQAKGVAVDIVDAKARVVEEE